MKGRSRKANEDLKRNKVRGKDNILPEPVKDGGEETIEYLRILFNKCPHEGV